MAHLAGINKGPVLDWTDDNGLMECYLQVEEKSGSSLQGSTQQCQ